MNISNKHIVTIVKKFPTDGHSPYLAISNDFDQLVVKPPVSSFDFGSIKKEFLCALFLYYWDILTPQIFTCDVSEELLINQLNNDLRFKLTDCYFASLFYEDATELNELFEFKGKVALKNIIDSEDLIKIALFDIWIENDDRKPTNSNVLLKSDNNQFRIYAIDHAFTFASLGLDGLYPGELSFSDNDSILYSEFGRELVKYCEINANWISKFEQYFYLCIENIINNFDLIVSKMPVNYQLTDDEVNKLKLFLFDENRNKKVFATLLYIINDIRK